MKREVLHFPGDEVPRGTSMAGDLPEPGELAPPGERPDARVFVREAGRILGSAALWWNETPQLEGRRVGAIGGFAASDGESARLLLDAACERLAAEGVGDCVGPMNGNTWRRHRFVIEGDGRKPFLMEPSNPPTFPGWWQEAGFSELSRYSSSLVPLDGRETVSSKVGERLQRAGVTVRPIEVGRYEEELRALHALSVRSFARNFLYTPLSEAEFLGAYGAFRERVDPQLVRVAERDGRTCGFVFAMADLLAVARGETPALIVKTLAVDPALARLGLGSLLVDLVHEAGRRKGFREAIHALQHETNSSRRITGRHSGQVFRRYALLSRSL